MKSTSILKLIIIVIGFLSILEGVAVICGWIFDVAVLKSFIPGYLEMVFNPALCFVLMGLALLITQFPKSSTRSALFFFSLSVTFILCLISLSEDLFQFDAGIDQLFATDKSAILSHYPFPGRMAANTAFCFVILSISYLGIVVKNRFINTLSQYLLHTVSAISSVALLGYLYGLSVFYNLSYVSSMAVHTAAMLFLISIAGALRQPSIGIAGLFTGKLVGNKMARRIFVLIVFMVFVFGSIRMQSQHYKIFSFEIGVSLFALCFLIVSLAIIWHTAIWLNKNDLKRYQAEAEIKFINERLEERVEQRTAQLTELFEKYRESELRFRTAFEYSPIGMALISLDGNWLKVNKRWCDLIGYSEQELINLTFLEITHPDDRELHVNLRARALINEHEAYQYEKRYITKGGAIILVSINFTAVRDSKGEPIYFISQFEDITQRKLVGEQLKKSEEKYRTLVEHASDAIYLINATGKFTEVNDSMCLMTGYKREELLNLNIEAIIDPEQLKADPVNYNLVKEKKSVIRERKFLCKDTSVLDVEINVTQFTVTETLVIARDITSRKKMENELRDAETKFRSLAEKSMVGVYISQHQKFIYVNPRFAEIFGYEPHELINTAGNAIEILISEEDQATVWENVEARYRGDFNVVNYEVTGKRKNGTRNKVEFYGSKVVINGEPSIIGSMLDVTERRNAEEILKRSEANLKTILDTTDTAYVLMDKKLNLMAFNKVAVKFINSEFKIFPGKEENSFDYLSIDTFQQFLQNELETSKSKRLVQFIKNSAEVLNGKSITYEISYPQLTGDVLWYYVRMFPILNDVAEIIGLMIELSDISDRKNAEEHLKSAYKKIQEHFDSIQDMAWKQSHLIRGPLANLKGLAQILNDTPGDTETLAYIQLELERLDNVLVEMATNVSNEETDG